MQMLSHGYDAEGHRIATTVNGQTTTWTVDPHGGSMPRTLIRTKPGGERTFYIYAGDILLYEIDETTNEARYYHYDHLGSTIAITNDEGEVTDRITYSAHGQTLARTGETDTPFLWLGAYGVQTDPNGLLHMRARYYHPRLARFLSEDPIQFEGGLNWYAYASGNPISRIDPLGLKDDTTAWQLGWEWATGTGPRHRDFTDGDPFTEQLRQHGNIQQGFQEASQRAAVAAQQGQSSAAPFNQSYRLDGFQGVPKYINDYSTLATGGATGNLAVTYLGSYQATVSISNINAQAGTANAQIVVRNSSNFASGTRPPVLGYTPFWQQYVAPTVNSFFATGPGSPTTQRIEMNQTIRFQSQSYSSRK